MIKAQTLKGFRDFLPLEAKRRQYILETLRKVFESYGFDQIETPALEYEEVLTGKYGEEGEKLMYKFKDRGGREVALRYDQTVPLARFIAQNINQLIFPFKRYQMQNVWRAENTQKGRFREFLQVDADIVGTSSLSSDIEIISITIDCLKKLGFKNFKVLVNSRKTFTELGVSDERLIEVIRSIDKMKKIGKQGVTKELTERGFSINEIKQILEELDNKKPSNDIVGITSKFKEVQFFPALARGLDYYTDLIFEVELEDYEAGSIAGGGRYDNLIKLFSEKDTPAVGVSFGFDRIYEAMQALMLFPTELSIAKVLVTYSKKAEEIASQLRGKKINTEVYLEDKALEKQLKYADRKKIPYVLIIDNEKYLLKDMEKRSQQEKNLEEVISFLALS